MTYTFKLTSMAWVYFLLIGVITLGLIALSIFLIKLIFGMI